MKEEKNRQQGKAPAVVHQVHASGAVRHIEKRRVATCAFADRVALVSLEVYRSKVPESFRLHEQQQTCVAAVLAHYLFEGRLEVVGLGVGTKFLPQSTLRREYSEQSGPGTLIGIDGGIYNEKSYGVRVRDSHAEVLARRAFRRYMTTEMLHYQQSRQTTEQGILEFGDDAYFSLKKGVTIHFYSSSAPCGNATLKKFATCQKEKYMDELDDNQWPSQRHELQFHSVPQGQTALLVKKDREVDKQACQCRSDAPARYDSWPCTKSDGWCPPGTTTVWYKQKGSLHTCSDKLCRWNVLGLQGSLLRTKLKEPLMMTSLTVGRKFSSVICQRAVCCRVVEPKKRKRTQEQNNGTAVNHPSLMCTSIYMDDSGVIDMTKFTSVSRDVQFNSTKCWAWWPGLEIAECIDGVTGFAILNGEETETKVSSLSTASLVSLFKELSGNIDRDVATLSKLREFKRSVSGAHEAAKDTLMARNGLFCQWRRRESDMHSEQGMTTGTPRSSADRVQFERKTCLSTP